MIYLINTILTIFLLGCVYYAAIAALGYQITLVCELATLAESDYRYEVACDDDESAETVLNRVTELKMRYRRLIGLYDQLSLDRRIRAHRKDDLLWPLSKAVPF